MYNNVDAVFGGSTNLLSLIELIYDSVEDVSLWPVVLDRIAEATHSEGTMFFAQFPHPATRDISATARMDEAALIPYAEHYASVNILVERCDRMFAPGTVRYSHQAIPDVEFEKTEFYYDYFKPNDFYYSFGIKVPVVEQPPGYLTLIRSRPLGEFREEEGTVLTTLLPHLQRALKLHLQFGQLRSNAGGMEAALDAFDVAVFGLNSAGRVVFVNQAGQQLAQAGDGIYLSKGRLVARDIKKNRELQILISGAVATGSGRSISSGGALLLNRRSDKPPLQVTISPFTSGVVRNYGQLVALVFAADGARKPLSRSATLRELYGLSPTECRLADLLAAGHEVSAVAEYLKITSETARFYLKSIFRKTGVNRQAALVRLVLSLPSVAAAATNTLLPY